MDKNTELYRQIFSNHPHATILFGLADGVIEDVNDSALSLYGYVREEMIGLPLSALSAEPEAKLNKRKDGTMLMIEAHRSVMKVDGREVGLSVIRELSPALPDRREAPDSERRFRRLADGVAHDVNDLLVGIKSLAEASIKALPAADPVRKDLEEVRLSTMRAALLTRPLLADGTGAST
jgi:PAS domain-containing protein